MIFEDAFIYVIGIVCTSVTQAIIWYWAGKQAGAKEERNKH